MELRFIEDKKNLVLIEIDGVGHGFCNLLKQELAADKDVKLATYRIDHPLIGVPLMRVEGSNPKVSVKKAVKKLQKTVSDLKAEFKKKIK